MKVGQLVAGTGLRAACPPGLLLLAVVRGLAEVEGLVDSDARTLPAANPLRPQGIPPMRS